MNYYCFLIIDNPPDFCAEIRDVANNVIHRIENKSDYEDLAGFAKKIELSKFHPEAVIHLTGKLATTPVSIEGKP